MGQLKIKRFLETIKIPKGSVPYGFFLWKHRRTSRKVFGEMPMGSEGALGERRGEAILTAVKAREQLTCFTHGMVWFHRMGSRVEVATLGSLQLILCRQNIQKRLQSAFPTPPSISLNSWRAAVSIT